MSANAVVGTGYTGVTGDPSAGGLNPAIIYNPTSIAVPALSVAGAIPGNEEWVPTNNVIPASYISPIAQAMQSFLPAPTKLQRHRE